MTTISRLALTENTAQLRRFMIEVWKGWGCRIGVVVGLSLAAGHAQAQPETWHNVVLDRSVEAGVRSRVWFAWRLLDDCSTRRGFNVRISGIPKSGVASLERATEVVSDAWIQPFMGRGRVRQVAHCTGRSAPVINVFYTPNRGFRGEDQMTVITTNVSGDYQNILTFRISVR